MRTLLLMFAILVASCAPETPADSAFPLVETTVSDIHDAFRDGRLTARALVQAYIDRIEAYDDTLNAILVVHPGALARADELDAEFRETGRLRPLHGIPILVKDNYDTVDLPTTAGSAALAGLVPPDDAYQVRVLREAGAIVLAKTNMAEWAFSAYVTESSIGGITRNPYDPSRVPAGSSGGTGAGVAANLGAVGLGTDTGNSIRGPSSHNALVGIRSTMGLTSRDGIVPLYLRNDIGGPMARTVEDAVRILDVIAGHDPADPVTARSEGHMPDGSYLDFLDEDGLRGARIGVFRRYMHPDSNHAGVLALTEQAVADLERLGATVVDPLDVPGLQLSESIWCEMFRHDVEAYFATRGPDFPFRTLASVIETGLFAPYIEDYLHFSATWEGEPCEDLYGHEPNIRFRDLLVGAMDEAGVDALVYPTWSYPPRLVGDRESPHGDNSQYLSPQSGLPAITVPTGFTEEGLPAGMTFIGRLFAEPDLIRFVYAYEQGTLHRRPPDGFGELE